ncbi:hypothetical protein PR048_027236 [Dryococelus australis]|uniref:Uncharacterized protein n=1 Tax=Dryococelus australis TaxID=614101 RepID=A0ABQ9GEW5_9NEOP|nr:hypothetical protein PR048_027236 [Dryococelus australis]
MQLVGGFLLGSPVSRALNSGSAEYSNSFILIGCQVLVHKGRPDLFTPLHQSACPFRIVRFTLDSLSTGAATHVPARGGVEAAAVELESCGHPCTDRGLFWKVIRLLAIAACVPRDIQPTSTTLLMPPARAPCRTHTHIHDTTHRDAAYACERQLTYLRVGPGEEHAEGEYAQQRSAGDTRQTLHCLQQEHTCSLYREQPIAGSQCAETWHRLLCNEEAKKTLIPRTPLCSIHSYFQLFRSPDNKITHLPPMRVGFDSQRGRSRIFALGGSCWRLFPRGSPVSPPPLHSNDNPYSPRLTLIGSKDLDAKADSHPPSWIYVNFAILWEYSFVSSAVAYLEDGTHLVDEEDEPHAGGADDDDDHLHDEASPRLADWSAARRPNQVLEDHPSHRVQARRHGAAPTPTTHSAQHLTFLRQRVLRWNSRAGGNGRSLRKPANQRRRTGRLPRMEVWEETSRESNLVRLGRSRASLPLRHPSLFTVNRLVYLRAALKTPATKRPGRAGMNSAISITVLHVSTAAKYEVSKRENFLNQRPLLHIAQQGIASVYVSYLLPNEPAKFPSLHSPHESYTVLEFTARQGLASIRGLQNCEYLGSHRVAVGKRGVDDEPGIAAHRHDAHDADGQDHDGSASKLHLARGREIPEKSHRSVASSGTIPTRENPGVTRPGIEPG